MSKKSAILTFLLIISPVLIYFLWPSDESRIKKLVKEGATAVEKKRLIMSWQRFHSIIRMRRDLITYS